MSVGVGWKCSFCRTLARTQNGVSYRPSRKGTISARSLHVTSTSYASQQRRLPPQESRNGTRVLRFEDSSSERLASRRTRDIYRKPAGHFRKPVIELTFPAAVLHELRNMRRKANSASFKTRIGLTDGNTMDLFYEFTAHLEKMALSWQKEGPTDSSNYLALRAAFNESPLKMSDTLAYWSQHYIAHKHVNKNRSIAASIARLADLRHPLEWYPRARQMRREIHLHIGPTNSGKTFHALKRLEVAESGIYAGPLRLLAHEIHNRLNAAGKPCDLLTGDVRISADSNAIAPMVSCTVEMVPTDRQVEVAVIDEIQMMADEHRGFAWTASFFGVAAKEVHLCGEERVLPLIRCLSAAMGDKLHIHRYERLNPLNVMPHSLGGKVSNLRKGDCVVAFSKVMIHMLRTQIEKEKGKKVAVIYGSLPPEVRTQQAALFNNPNNEYDFLVASDAIGMGLNLNIKRVVFADTWKSDGKDILQLQDAQMKQIGGRAGRFRVAPPMGEVNNKTSDNNVELDALEPPTAPSKSTPAPGLVTTLSEVDMPSIQRGIAANIPPLRYAGIFPPRELITSFASLFPTSTPFTYILHRLSEIADVKPPFKLCSIDMQCRIADMISPFEGLQVQDRMSFCEAPISKRAEIVPAVLEIAKRVESRQCAPLLDLKSFKIELLDRTDKFNYSYLTDLEILHESLGLYMWLSYRFENILISRPLASHVKELVQRKIEVVLAAVTKNSKAFESARRRRERNILHELAAAVTN